VASCLSTPVTVGRAGYARGGMRFVQRLMVLGQLGFGVAGPLLTRLFAPLSARDLLVLASAKTGVVSETTKVAGRQPPPSTVPSGEALSR
jgi:hypothetical protein